MKTKYKIVYGVLMIGLLIGLPLLSYVTNRPKQRNAELPDPTEIAKPQSETNQQDPQKPSDTPKELPPIQAATKSSAVQTDLSAEWKLRPDIKIPNGTWLSAAFHETEKRLYLLLEADGKAEGGLFQQNGSEFKRIGPAIQGSTSSDMQVMRNGRFEKLSATYLRRYVFWFDPATKQLSVYGGLFLDIENPALYTWDGKEWKKKMVANEQRPGGIAPAVCVDTKTQATFAFGGGAIKARAVPWGAETGSPRYTFFKLDSAVWQKIADVPDHYSMETAFVFDPGRDAFFLFGGSYNWWRLDDAAPLVSATVSGDSHWISRDGNIEKIRASNGPSPRCFARAIYHTSRKAILLFGGVSFTKDEKESVQIHADTWLFENGRWTEASANLPVISDDALFPQQTAMIYYPPEKCAWLFCLPPSGDSRSPKVFEFK